MKLKLSTLPYHYLWLLLIFGAAAYVRLYHGFEPVPTYWDDFAGEIVAPRNILDFNANHWVFDVGRREPFFSYFTALVWLFAPSAHGLVIQRLSCVLLDLLALWVLYLAGKELAGKRAGVVLAGLAAVNRDMWLKCLLGMRIASLPLAMALLLLYTLRVFRRPDAKHLIQWSFALAFGLYTYTSYRSFLPWVILLVLYFLWKPLKGMEGLKHFKLCVGAVLVLFLFYYAMANSLVMGGLFNDGYVHGFFLLFLVVLLFVGGWLTGRTAGLEVPPNNLANGAMAVSLASLLMFPMLAQRAISDHMAGLSIFTLPMHGVGDLLTLFLKRSVNAFLLLVDHGKDRADMSPVGASMVGLEVGILAVVGVLFAIWKRDIKGGLCGLLVLAGVAPYLLTTEPHSGKLSGIVVPLLALAVLGIENLVDNRWLKKLGFVVPLVVLALLVGWGTWQAKTDLKLIYQTWPTKGRNAQIEAYRQLKNDLQNHEVYFAAPASNGLSWETQDVLEEGRDIHPFQELNVLTPHEGRSIQGVLVYLPPQDEEALQNIARYYHAVDWDVKGSNGQVFFTRVEIPLSEIQKNMTKKKRGPFVIRENSSGFIHRRFYGARYGLGRGLARGEDWVASAKEPMPDWVKKGFGVKLDRDLQDNASRRFQEEASYPDKTWWWVDGKSLGNGQVIDAGRHHLECFVDLQNSLDLPANPVLGPR